MSDEVVVLGKCPVCKEGDIVEKAKSYACTKAEWKNNGTDEAPEWVNEGCKYSIFKGALNRMGGEEITAENVKELLEKESFPAKLTNTKQVRIDSTYGVKIDFKS